jgi:4-hydroxy-3-polyprenylbenzoate decarboxylase
MHYPICVGITGASGAVYAVRLLEVLCAGGYDVHLSISAAGRDVIRHELGREIDLDDFRASSLLPDGSTTERLHYEHWQDYHAPMASGSFLTAGMVICPCSGATLSAVANGAANNLIQRAAEVHLKERRKLVIVPRETPLSLAHIENMRAVTLAGAIVLPASPGWYNGVESTGDLIDFIVARICDQLAIDHSLISRWGKTFTTEGTEDTESGKVNRSRTGTPD